MPIKLGPFHGDCITEYEFIIQDCKDIHCSLEKFIGKVCCPPSPEPCKLSELVVEKSDCNQDNQFYLHLNFKANNASECFKVFLNGAFLGEFPYASLPLKIGPFPGDCKTEYKLLVKDCKDPHCNLEKILVSFVVRQMLNPANCLNFLWNAPNAMQIISFMCSLSLIFQMHQNAFISEVMEKIMGNSDMLTCL